MKIEEMGYLEEMRQRLGLEANDTSKDDYIESLDRLDRVRLLSGWYLGSTSWVDTFVDWLESQGIYLTTNIDNSDI